MAVASQPDHDALVIGAGFSGIGAAIKLDEAGFGDFLVVEEGDGVGGAWHWNTYPGIGVDIPSFSYQFSFEQQPDWSRVYAPGEELKAYAEHCVDKYDVRRRIRLNTRVTAATFDEPGHFWRISTDDGKEITARFVIGATGVFSKPTPPELAGLDDFQGHTMHTARWDHDYDLAGKRVGIIGTGASAVQVIPAIAPQVEHLTVFQRTPIWCLPKPDRRIGSFTREILRRVPGANWLSRAASQAFVEATFPIPLHYSGLIPFVKLGERAGRKLLQDQVRDPAIREKLTPQYGVGCKRPSFSNDYLPAFNRDNVTLETEPIERATREGILTEVGSSYDLDVLILATGFKVFAKGNMPPFAVRGLGGVDLEEWWDENRYQAYEGVSVPGFPNIFTILGPYAYNGSSYFQLIETRMRHITRCLKEARRTRSTLVDVKPEANARYFKEMLAKRKHQALWQDSCSLANSYYFDSHGDAPFRPATSLEIQWRSARFDLSDYRFEAAPA